MTLNIKNTTLVCIDTKNKIEALLAIDRSLDKAGFTSCKFFTDNVDNIKMSKYKNIHRVEIVEIPPIKSVTEYSAFCINRLNDYVSTDFCLTIQHDGYILHPECWTDEFFAHDYTGAAWPPSWGYKHRVGNGGFSLRSKRYLEKVQNTFRGFDFKTDLPRDKDDVSVNEDYLVCNTYYDFFIAHGITFAPPALAAIFSREHPVPEMKDKSFGFHGNFMGLHQNFI